MKKALSISVLKTAAGRVFLINEFLLVEDPSGDLDRTVGSEEASRGCGARSSTLLKSEPRARERV